MQRGQSYGFLVISASELLQSIQAGGRPSPVEETAYLGRLCIDQPSSLLMRIVFREAVKLETVN